MQRMQQEGNLFRTDVTVDFADRHQSTTLLYSFLVWGAGESDQSQSMFDVCPDTDSIDSADPWVARP